MQPETAADPSAWTDCRERSRPLAHLGRLLAICARSGWFAARLAARLLARRIRRQEPAAAVLGEELARLCEALGPTFIKLGQILSSRPDLLTPRIAGPLARLQDEIPPFDARLLPALLESAFGRPVDELFARVDPRPLAAASIAQVHRARLHDGREVVLKVLRPGVRRRIQADLGLLRAVASAVGWLPPLRTAPLAELVEALGVPVLRQTELLREAESIRRFHRCFAGIEHVRFPRLIEPLCRDTVLVMEYLADLQKVTASSLGAEERRTAALAGLRALYRMIFLDGFVHADMHPGNVFLRRWGELVILDAGLVAELSPADRRDFVDFFFALVNNQGRVCARIVWDNALYRKRGCDRVGFEAEVEALIARYSGLRARNFEVTAFVAQLIETQRRFGIRGHTSFIMTVLSMVVYDGICKLLHPDCDFQSEARPYLITARYSRQTIATN